jgi:hypothetical protein
MRVILRSPIEKDRTVARNTQPPAGTSPGTELNQDSISGKGHATPTRKEKEAARKRPLVANDRGERRRREREAAAVERERARIGMANGDPKYMQLRDRGPQRKFARDYVDARWSFGELLLPTIVLYFISSFFPNDAIALSGTLLMFGVIFGSIIDAVIVGSILKKKLAEKFGSMEKGVRFYAAMRMVYFRGMRLPKPQVQRGDFPA